MFFTILLTACPNAAGGGGTSSGGNTGGGSSAGPAYVKVPYAELETYLANTASADKVNYIEVTDIPIADFEGAQVGSSPEAGILGQKIKAHPAKKVALKLPGKVEGLESMRLCFFGCTNLVSLANIPEGIKNMGSCFYGCTSLTKGPVIPASVRNMNSCFVRCTGLTEIPDIPPSVENMNSCFVGCTGLTEVPAIPPSVTSMSYCFDGCTGLTEISAIPASVTDMRGCFKGCTALKRVKLHCGYNPAVIGIEKAFRRLFKDCTSLEEDGVKVPAAFYNNYTADEALDVMAVPGGTPAEQAAKFATIGGEPPIEYVKVSYAELKNYLRDTASSTEINYIEATDIPKEHFNDGSGHTSTFGQKIKDAAPKKVTLKLPGEVEGLDSMFACFFGCTNLVSLVNIPSSVTNMESCFNGCTSLTQAPVIPANVTDMYYCFEDCTSLTKAPVIPANVTDMRGCFSGCTSLTEAPVILASATYMEYCFNGCTSLTKAPVIPANVTYMRGCFADCTGLTEIPDIPASVTDMRGCFEGCTALKRVKLHCNYNPADIGIEKAFLGLFENCTSLEKGGVQVPGAFLGNYTAAEALDVMKVPPVGNTAEQKKKFSTF